MAASGSMRKPELAPGPLFTLVRSASNCAWALRADVPGELAAELARLAGEAGTNLTDSRHLNEIFFDTF